MVAIIWGFTLFMCFRQAELCEKRSVNTKDKCSVEWQLAITAGMGMGQSVFSLWTQPPQESPRRRRGMTSAVKTESVEP